MSDAILKILEFAYYMTRITLRLARMLIESTIEHPKIMLPVIGTVIGILIALVVVIQMLGSLPSSSSPSASQEAVYQEAGSLPSSSSPSASSLASNSQYGGGSSSLSEQELGTAVQAYYEAVERKDWTYTYNNLDSQTQQRFTRSEWIRKNQYFDNIDPISGLTPKIVSEVSTSSPVKVIVTRTFRSGTTTVRPTYFVWEEGSWKHRFSQEEYDLFMADSSYDEFVRVQEGGSSAGSEKSLVESSSEETAVKDAIKGHYAAIGAGDFKKAYSYFGPTFRNQIQNNKQGWINKEKSYQIQSTTINSLKVSSVSGNQATATVDFSVQDNTGTPRFLITWNLVKEGGRWKLDSLASGEKIG
jgi:hypothetical protein